MVRSSKKSVGYQDLEINDRVRPEQGGEGVSYVSDAEEEDSSRQAGSCRHQHQQRKWIVNFK